MRLKKGNTLKFLATLWVNKKLDRLFKKRPPKNHEVPILVATKDRKGISSMDVVAMEGV